jgi:hypothetical protein
MLIYQRVIIYCTSVSGRLRPVLFPPTLRKIRKTIVGIPHSSWNGKEHMISSRPWPWRFNGQWHHSKAIPLALLVAKTHIDIPWQNRHSALRR